MGLFDSLKRSAESQLRREATKAVRSAVNDAIQSTKQASYRKEKFTFDTIPSTVEELQALPEANLDSPFKAAALAIVALMNYENNPDVTYQMLDFLNGPDEVTAYNQQFLRDRLRGKQYKVRSFFEGATPENNYQPVTPYTIVVSENAYSYPEENWATLYVKSGGADSARPIKLRKKPSTGQWFVNEIQCLSDIRLPVESDPWA